MRQSAARPGSLRLRRRIAVVLVVVTSALIGIGVHQSVASSAHSFLGWFRGDDSDARTTRDGGRVTVADGVLPARVTVFDTRYPGVTKLDPTLLGKLREAGTEAAHQGITLYVNSGWRSAGYQNALLRAAVARYGSARTAALWVATADTSAHVTGDAADIGDAGAATWLAEHGAGYGLCQIYRNEPWHFELRPHASELGCPAMYPDPPHDPRMRS